MPIASGMTVAFPCLPAAHPFSGLGAPSPGQALSRRDRQAGCSRLRQLDVCSPPWFQLRHGPWSRRILARTMATTSLRVFMGARDWDSGSTTQASSGCRFSNFLEEFPGPSEIQVVFLHLSNEQRDADLDRPTPCRHIKKRGSAPPDSRPDFSQPLPHQSVIKFDQPTGSGINSVRRNETRFAPP